MRASTVSCTCMVSRCRTARMPCTWLQNVGTLSSSSSCCLGLEKESMRRQTSPLPCCTVQPRGVTVGWHATSLMRYTWTHRTGTRCLGCQGTVLVSNSKCVIHQCVCVCVCVCVCSRKHAVLCNDFRVLSHSLLAGSCLVTDHQFQY